MDDDQRTDPPLAGDERATLTAFLQYHRDTLALKCAGLTPDQLRERAVPPSSLSLLGLVRHMAEVERGWFRMVLNGERLPMLWSGEDDPDADFNDVGDADQADVDEAFRAWNEECERSRAIVDAAESLEVAGHRRDREFSLRWILTHMIEEYARHNGHADLLRERIDGATGE